MLELLLSGLIWVQTLCKGYQQGKLAIFGDHILGQKRNAAYKDSKHLMLNESYKISYKDSKHLMLNESYNISYKDSKHLMLNESYKISYKDSKHLMLNESCKISSAFYVSLLCLPHIIPIV